jgi:hypothetical protein
MTLTPLFRVRLCRASMRDEKKNLIRKNPIDQPIEHMPLLIQFPHPINAHVQQQIRTRRNNGPQLHIAACELQAVRRRTKASKQRRRGKMTPK